MTDNELIQAVATKVMGWDQTTTIIPAPGRCAVFMVTPHWDMGCFKYIEVADWNPLTNDAHMDMVLERARQLGDGTVTIAVFAGVGQVLAEVQDDTDLYGDSRLDEMTMDSIKSAMLMAIVEAAG